MRLHGGVAAAAAALLVAGCGAGPTPPAAPPPKASAPETPGPARTAPKPPTWLGTRALPLTAAGFGEQQPTPRALRVRRFTLPDTVAALPGRGFTSRISDPAPAAVIARSTWIPGCPVTAGDLAWIRLAFHGFDGRRHTGELLVNRAVARDVVAVFGKLYAAGFPMEELRITTRAEQTAAPTGDGNDTGSFNCRPVRGQTAFSQHAYGLAVDVNPFQNPYEKGDLVLPELAGAYTDRTWKRPGMIFPDGPVVRAFSSIGWTWGGTWRSLKDLQHFSRNGS